MTSKYCVYQTLAKRLSRSGFKPKSVYKQYPHSGSIATYLCDLFMKFEGIVYKDELVRYNVIFSDDNMNDFVAALVKAKYITWDLEDNKRKGLKHYQVFASHKLADLLNKEKHEEVATKRDIAQLKVELALQRACVDKIINFMNPPVTDGKRKKMLAWDGVSTEIDLDS